MALRKFGQNDIVLNTMKAYPNSEFFIFGGHVYYNDRPKQSGSFSTNIIGAPVGFVSLYEYNIDKLSGSVFDSLLTRDTFNNYIYPFIYKDGARASFRTAVGTGTPDEWSSSEVGDVLYGSYPLTASITRDYTSDVTPSTTATATDDAGAEYTYNTAPVPRNFFALTNRLRYYGIRAKQYKDLSEKTSGPVNVISVPSIFYGSRIKPGTVSLKWYFTGSLIGELQDTKHNGQLIQVSGSKVSDADDHDGQVAGVIMYDEGIMILTGSWDLNNNSIGLDSAGGTDRPQWIYFGAGAADGVTVSSAHSTFTSASFETSFKGATETQVFTMFAHARRGEVNYSNNPTFLQYGQEQMRLTSSQIYEENPHRLLANVVSSSYAHYSASFERIVYVSRVGIYDDSKNLIGIATLANPIKKQEDQDITFKLKLDV